MLQYCLTCLKAAFNFDTWNCKA